jgi:F0F1-type ATP synthase epsilon subunit
MFINSLYAEDTDFLNDLINLIKSLTSRNIEIGIMPVRTDLIKYLSTHGFKINQADYIKSVSGC